MKKNNFRVKTVILSLFAALVLSLSFAGLSQPAYAQGSIADNVCKGILDAEGQARNNGTTAASCTETGDNTFSSLAKRIINLFSIVVGAVSVIMIIIGGFRYIISGGDSAGVTGAKNTILYAVVGLVIVLFAQVIIRFIFTNASPTT